MFNGARARAANLWAFASAIALAKSGGPRAAFKRQFALQGISFQRFDPPAFDKVEERSGVLSCINRRRSKSKTECRTCRGMANQITFAEQLRR